MSATILPPAKQAFTGPGGIPLIGGMLYTYAAGTNTPLATFQDAAGTVANTNPIILDARGEALIFWLGTYKVVLQDALGNVIWSVDNIASTDPLLSVLGQSGSGFLVNNIAQTRAEMAAMTGLRVGGIVFLAEAGREGEFEVKTGSSPVSDPSQGIYVVSNQTGYYFARVFTGSLSATWFGAVASLTDTLTDCAPAINAAMGVAHGLQCGVSLPGGALGVASTIMVLERATLDGQGCGYGDFPAVSDRIGTLLVAMPALGAVDVIRCGTTPGQPTGDQVISNLSVNGAFIASVGLNMYATRARLDNVHVWKCRHSAFLWQNSQNCVAANLYHQGNLYGHTFMNGARNNMFYGCSGTTFASTYAQAPTGMPAFSATAAIQGLIDTTGTLFAFPTDNSITSGGNDQNRFFGGIFESSATSVIVRNAAGITTNNATAGLIEFKGVEFSDMTTVVDTNTAAYTGAISFEDCTFIGGSMNVAAIGTLGTINFAGEGLSFSGFDTTAQRGFSSIRNNLNTLAYVRSNDLVAIGGTTGVTVSGGATTTFDPVSKRFTIAGTATDQSDGVNLNMGGPFARGNNSSFIATTTAQLPLIKVSFLVENAGSGTVNLYALDSTSPGRRLIGAYANGPQSLVFAASATQFQGVRFGIGSAAAGVQISSVSVTLA